MIHKKTAGCFCCKLVAVGFVLGLNSPAAAQNVDEFKCQLKQVGDCCSVTIDRKRKAIVQADIDHTAQVNYVIIANNGKSDCILDYDGEMRVPMRVRSGGISGTWLGGTFSLNYQVDAMGQGSCPLAVYYLANGYDNPPVCTNEHFSPVLHQDEALTTEDENDKAQATGNSQ